MAFHQSSLPSPTMQQNSQECYQIPHPLFPKFLPKVKVLEIYIEVQIITFR